MKVIVLTALLLAGQAFACGTLPPAEQRARERADVERQEGLVRDLAPLANDIFLGEVTEIDDASGTATVRIARVLKGDADPGMSEWRLPSKSLVISCSSADMFKNVTLHKGRSYFLYASGGTLLRAGWLERDSGDISVRQESNVVKSIGGET